MLANTQTAQKDRGAADAHIAVALLSNPKPQLSPMDRIPTIPQADGSGLLRRGLSGIMKYSVLEVRNCSSSKLILRFGDVRRSDVLSRAKAEVEQPGASLQVAEVESGTITAVGDVISINGPASTGMALKMLREAQLIA